MLGAQGSPYLLNNQWQISFGYRYQKSDRHFTGSEEDEERKSEGSEVINHAQLLDFAATYAITDRINATLSLPVLIADRSQPVRNASRDIVFRNETEANGIGDMSLSGLVWLLDPATNITKNISLGTGVKFPTGEDDVTDAFHMANGTQQVRTVDQSIQPGDGGFGWIVSVNAFMQFFDLVTAYAQGTYLFNPRNTNHVPTFRGRESESIMSVSDQYIARIGFAMPVIPPSLLDSTPRFLHGLGVIIGGRIEGVPVYDLIGHSDGFRRPGYAVSIEPGLQYVYGRHAFAATVPVALFRDRLRSVPDKHDDTHGDAAFADYLVTFGYSMRLGSGAATPPPVIPEPTPSVPPGT